jgi:deoxyribodipyrimidine photo-lyase
MAVVARTVVWFRRDLRLAANRAIAAAAVDGEVVPLFVVDPTFDHAGAPRRAYLTDALNSLDAAIGGHLVYRRGNPLDVVPALAAEVGASSVVAADDFGPYGRRRDDSVAARLEADGRSLRRVGSNFAISPGTIRRDGDQAYAVFTPFFRRWSQVPLDAQTADVDIAWLGTPKVRSDGPPLRPTVTCSLPDATEAAALARLEEFIASGAVDRYGEARNLPGVAGTSRLSPYLRWGLIHPQQVLNRIGGTDADAFRRELCWREFYADVLYAKPETAWHNVRREMDTMPVDTDVAAQRRFRAWAEGRTGYPIVDAGMRQLLATGWMHNRVRMIVASFLVKDLHLPWQWGARHFMAHLVDGDLASNSHGWQWTAGTGTDAAPYFRIFNPTLQSERYDPDGDYIRCWVPELEHLGSTQIHAPHGRAGGLMGRYPAPIVDHAAERVESLRRLAAVPPISDPCRRRVRPR